MRRRALLIVNPVSRRGGDEAERASRLLAEAGLDLVCPDASDPGRYADLVRSHRESVDLVVVGGGDGSINLALPALIGQDLPLGVLPLGTANNLARNLGLPTDLAEACGVIAAGHSRRIDVADVNGHYFLNVAGLGLSSEVNRKVPKDLKRRFGVLAYAVYALKVARRMRPFRAEIIVDSDDPILVRSMQITVCNGRHYGSGMTIADDAAIDDGRLDLCSTEVDRWWRGLRNIPALMRGDPERAPDVRWLAGSRLTINTRKAMRIDADGEMVGRTPAEFRVHRRRLAVFVAAEPPASD